MITILLSYPLGKECGHSFEQIWIRFFRGCFMPSLAEIGSVILEKIFHLNKIWTPLHKDTLCQVRLKLAKWFWRWFFLILSMSLETGEIIICINLNPFHQIMLLLVVEIGPLAMDKFFFLIVYVLLLFRYIVFPL